MCCVKSRWPFPGIRWKICSGLPTGRDAYCRKPQTGVDVFTRAEFLYSHAVTAATAVIGAKQEGDLCITGTQGYTYVPAPWWKTGLFEVHFEDPQFNKKYRNYLL